MFAEQKHHDVRMRLYSMMRAALSYLSIRKKSPPQAMDTYIFLVGVNDEWSKGRKEIGDIALCRCFRMSVPESQIVFVRDSEATVYNTQQQLERLLQGIQGGPCKVVVYFGGHGKPDGFCMADDILCRHRDIVDLIETYLRKGDTCWFLIDCCYSGSFCTSLQQRVVETGGELKGSYCCLMTTTHDTQAGPEWTLTESWIRAMRGMIPSHYKDSKTSYVGHQWVPTTAQVVSFISDEIARVKKDRMTTYICGDSFRPDESFPFIIKDKDTLSYLDTTSTSVFGRCIRLRGGSHNKPRLPPHERSVGDEVYAKWRGGKPTAYSSYLMPTWYLATVIALDVDCSFRVNFHCPTTSLTWEGTVDKDDVIEELCFHYRYYEESPSGIEKAQCYMAECGKYMTYALSVGTKVWALWDDHEVLYEGTIMSDRDLPWQEMEKTKFEEDYPGNVGAFVPVRWVVDEKWSIIPLGHCFAEDDSSDAVPSVAEMRQRARIAEEQESTVSYTPMELLMCSFRSAGKTLRPVEEVVDGAELMCFWAGSSEWLSAAPGELDPNDLGVLASHLHYKEGGDYCVIRWEDGTQSCLPKKFLRRRLI